MCLFGDLLFEFTIRRKKERELKMKKETKSRLHTIYLSYLLSRSALVVEFRFGGITIYILHSSLIERGWATHVSFRFGEIGKRPFGLFKRQVVAYMYQRFKRTTCLLHCLLIPKTLNYA